MAIKINAFLLIIIISTQALSFKAFSAGFSNKGSCYHFFNDVDTTLVSSTLIEAEKLIFKNPDSSILLADHAYALSEQPRYERGKIEALLCKMKVFNIRGEWTEVRNIYTRLVNEPTNVEDPILLANIIYEMGMTFMTSGRVDSSKYYLNKAFELRISEGDSIGLVDSNMAFARMAVRESDYEAAIEWLQKAKLISEKLNYSNGILSSLNIKAFVYARKGLIEEAKLSYEKMLSLAKKSENYYFEVLALGGLSNVFLSKADYQKALLYIIRSLEISERLSLKRFITTQFGRISHIYIELEDYEKARLYLERSMKVAEEIQDLFSIAFAKKEFGKLYQIENKHLEALTELKSAFRMADSLGFKTIKSRTNVLIGEIHLAENNLQEAQRVFHESLSLFDSIQESTQKALTFNKLALTYLRMGNYAKCIKYAEQAVALTEPENQKKIIQNALELISKSHLAQKSYKEAYTYFELQTRYKDSILNEENLMIINQMQTVYETEKKQREIDNLNQQTAIQKLEIERKELTLSRIILVSFVFLLTLLLVILLVVYVYDKRRLRANREKAMLEQKLLRSQMNPYFLYNSLMSIQKFIYQNRPKEGGAFVAKFARLIRLILENSRDEFISLEREVETLELYLELQKNRHNDQFSFEISLDTALDLHADMVPPMMAQPFIENSLAHGFKNIETVGMIKVKFMKTEEGVLFELTDNGEGIDEETKDYEGHGDGHRSLATTITKERLLIFNKGDLSKSRLTIQNKKDMQDKTIGTCVSFLLPSGSRKVA